MFSVLMMAAAFVASADDQYTPTDVTAQQIVEKYHAAVGHVNGNSYLIVRRLVRADGVETASTQIVGNDWVEIDQRGPITTLEGSSNGQSWWQDANGTVLLESGIHHPDSDGQYWLDPDNAASMRVLGLTQTEPREYVVETTTADGKQRAYFDAQTFLLDRVDRTGSDGSNVVREYSDYRPVDGEMVAFRTRDSDGNAADDVDEQIVSFTENQSVVPAIPSSRLLFALPDTLVVLPVSMDEGGQLIVHATISGHSADFVLDSGADGLTIDPGVARNFGLQEVGGEAVASDVSIGSLRAHNVVFDLVHEVGEFGQLGQSVAGLMGCDFFANAIVSVDLKNKEVKMYPRSSFNPSVAGIQPMAMDVDDCLPRVPASFGGVTGSFVVDTGGFATMLFPGYLGKIHNAWQSPDTPEAYAVSGGYSVGLGAESTIFGVNGNVAVKTYDVPDFSFGPARFQTGEVLVPAIDPSFGGLDARAYDGIIGRNVLLNYVVYFDYADRLFFMQLNH